MVIAVFTKVGHGTFSLIIIMYYYYYFYISNLNLVNSLGVQHPKYSTDSLENYSAVVVEGSTFE